MVISSMTPAELLLQVSEILEPLLGKPVGRLEEIGYGRNSRVYKLAVGDKWYAVKFCMDGGRVAREFTCLEFLSQNGFCDVPQPVALDPDARCAVYVFAEGDPIEASEVASEDIDSAVDFLVRLHKLSQDSGSGAFDNASEACFSIQDIICNIRDRMDRLQRVQETGQEYDRFRAFLSDRFEPGVSRVYEWVRSYTLECDIWPEARLPFEHRTLSPSDFGFHNMLRRPDGSLIFLDFEHFGWDDPIKMVCDVLLHPHEAMAVPEMLKRQFLSKMLAYFPGGEELKRRFHFAYPLLGLKWCTILLNEFVPTDLDRRVFAGDSGADRSSVQRRQLGKAERMLDSVLATYQHFPYEN